MTYGELEVEDGVAVVFFRRRRAHPPEKVWRALTEPAQLEAWFPTTIEGERAAGAKLHFAFRQNEAPDFDGEMQALDPPSLPELGWGEDLFRFEPTGASGGDGARLHRPDGSDGQGRTRRGRVARLSRPARVRGHRAGAAVGLAGSVAGGT